MLSATDILQAKILIVDDQPVNVQLLEYLLTSSGYTAVSSTTDPRVVAEWHAAQCYDLIILDLHMPGMDGYAVMAALKPLESDSYLPVLVVTADPDSKLAALEAGARDFVGKPFDPLEVLTRIRNMLEVRLLHSEARHYNALLEQTVRERTAELQRFRSAMDATADAIFLLDAASLALVDVNDGACRMLGYARAALMTRDQDRASGRPGPAPACLAALREHAGRLLLQANINGAARAPELADIDLPRQDGALVPAEIYWQLQERIGQPTLLLGVARDISERRQAQQRLQHMAHYDALTGLPNRTLFYQTLADAVELAKDKQWRIVVLFISLDRFKTINDTLGAERGDELLRQFSNRLVQCVRIRDTVGRLGGDEFALILTMTLDQQDAILVANAVREALRAPFDLHGQAAALTASIGIAMYPDDATEPATLIKYADTAMDRAKQAGRDGYRFFTAGMNVQVLARLDLEIALRRALEQNELLLYYQPKINLHSGRIAGAEALLRWHRGGYGMVYPAEFVPVLEETGLIVRVGTWIIEQACRQIAEWCRSPVGPVRVAVNVSSRQFVEGDLVHDVRQALEQHQVPAELLELELTETALMQNAERTITVLTSLREMGIKIAIDDFGTGYSALSYLTRFPIATLKIDRSFTQPATGCSKNRVLMEAIVAMAHGVGLSVVAEGVETRELADWLAGIGCDMGQGYLWSNAVPAHTLLKMETHARGSLASCHDDGPVHRSALGLINERLL